MERRPPERAVVLGPFERGVAHFDASDLMYRHLAGVQPTGGILVDVGARHARSIGQFCDSGWVVHTFEPKPNNSAALEQNIDSAWSSHIKEEAVSEVDGETSEICDWSAEAVRLSSYLDRHDVAHVDFLKIETEGHALFVLRSFPWETDAPDAIACEFRDNKTVPLGYTSDELAEFLADKGYHVLVSEWHPLSGFDDSPDFLTLRRYESETLSSAAWGNFLAVRSVEAADVLIGHAKARGVDIRERADKLVIQRGVATFPDEFPDSPSAIPLIAGAAERAGEPSPTTEVDFTAMASVPSNPIALLKRLVKFYLAPTGLVLAAALVLVAVSLIGFDFSWLFGVAGIGLLGLYLPYKLAKIDERQYAQSNALNERVKGARVAGDQARLGVGEVHDELRRSIERLDERIDRLSGE